MELKPKLEVNSLSVCQIRCLFHEVNKDSIRLILQPSKSSQRLHALFIYGQFGYNFPIYGWISQEASTLQVSVPFPHVFPRCCVLRVSLSPLLMCSPLQHLAKSTIYYYSSGSNKGEDTSRVYESWFSYIIEHRQRVSKSISNFKECRLLGCGAI
jgi:hypothetical protein